MSGLRKSPTRCNHGDRRAHELDVVVISRLLALALHLQGTLTLLDGRAAARVTEVVDELDAIVSDVRTVIFDMAHRPAPGGQL